MSKARDIANLLVKIPSSISTEEIATLEGITSNIQNQLNTKQASGSYLTSVPAATSSNFGGVKASLSGTTLTLSTL